MQYSTQIKILLTKNLLLHPRTVNPNLGNETVLQG